MYRVDPVDFCMEASQFLNGKNLLHSHQRASCDLVNLIDNMGFHLFQMISCRLQLILNLQTCFSLTSIRVRIL